VQRFFDQDALEAAVPDYCEPVSGWRMWYCVDSGGEARLASLFYPTIWPLRTALAGACARHGRRFFVRRRTEPHGVPEARCGCGIHAASPSLFVDSMTESSFVGSLNGQLLPSRVVVFGRVQLWGKVIECQHGWRASYAYPQQLYLVRRRASDVAVRNRALELARYGVPVTILDAPSLRESVWQIGALADVA
jgi:hypothetical protein